MSRLRRTLTLCVTGATALLALVPVATASAGSAPPPARAGGAAQASGGSADYFNSDSCPRRTFCIAVGTHNQVGISQVLRAGSWVPVPVPTPSRGINVFANEVACASPASCLFVGEHWAGRNGPTADLAQAWNGSAWRLVVATGPARTAVSGLDDVACPTPKFCLVVGYAGSSRGYQDSAYTWSNGHTWRRISVPHPAGVRNSALGGLACFNASNCMAVGNYTSKSGRYLPFAARWHNGRWQLLTTPAIPRQRFTEFQAVACPLATLCMAVGDTEDNTRGLYFHAFAEDWTGGKWHISMLGQRASVFGSVACPAPRRCFASGYAFPRLTSFAHALIETWNGRTWTPQHPVETRGAYSGDIANHVSCAASTDCEAVGERFVPSSPSHYLTLAERWNGHGWALQTTINP